MSERVTKLTALAVSLVVFLEKKCLFVEHKVIVDTGDENALKH